MTGNWLCGMAASKLDGAGKRASQRAPYRLWARGVTRLPIEPKWALAGVGALAGWGIVVALCLALPPVAAAEGKPFGLAQFAMQTTHPTPTVAGEPGPGFVNEPYVFTQAGGHPDALTTTLEFASETIGEGTDPTRDPKDMVIDLPAGLTANPLAVPLCPHQLAISGGSCPSDSQVGVYEFHDFGNKAQLGPIFDMTPEAGQSAELGFSAPFVGTLPLMGRLVRTPAGYGLRIVGNGLPALSIISVETSLWGVPSAASHDPERGLDCAAITLTQPWNCEGGGVTDGAPQTPFLSMPTDCSAGPLLGVAWSESWEEPGRVLHAQATLPGVTKCNEISFNPDLEVRPDTGLPDAPVGITVNIGIEQQELTTTNTAPQLRAATVTLPEGVSISAGVAAGLQACQATGPEGIDMPTGLNPYGEPLEPGEVGEGEELAPSGEARLATGHCPPASAVGTAEAITPLLPAPIKGRVYLALPGCGGPRQNACSEQDAVDGNLYHLYIELGGHELSPSGVDIKIEGRVEANPATGQLTVVLLNNPELPLSQLTLSLNGGPRALLSNPATCGHATTTAALDAWSAPGTTPGPESQFMPGTADATASSFYEVTGCPTTTPFTPALLAGTTIPQAGVFTPFTFTVTRADGEQYLSRLQLRSPQGLAAMLSNVPPCEEPAASQGLCPAASRIGSTVVDAGAGSAPLELPGAIYLTRGYAGAPFGLSIVTSAVAGPLNLGQIVIRSQVNLDPETAALIITSEPLPQIVAGVPLRIRRVTLNMDRPNFMFNPTNCTTQEVTATIVSTEGTQAHDANRFAIGGCRNLTFTPTMKAATSGHTSFVTGASLDMALSFPAGEPGAQANLAAINIALPEQLPARLTTMQQACQETTFTADPAACPAGAIIGIARARTPVLPAEMDGPVYFVAHGRNTFPSPVVILEGDGVRLDLAGTTSINAKGTTHVAFKTIPDIPIDSFELYLPQSRHSLLGANTELCPQAKPEPSALRSDQHATTSRARGKKKTMQTLLMATELVAQNGEIFHHSIPITVGGCVPTKHKPTKRAAS
jgi:hypothetical protein